MGYWAAQLIGAFVALLFEYKLSGSLFMRTLLPEIMYSLFVRLNRCLPLCCAMYIWQHARSKYCATRSFTALS